MDDAARDFPHRHEKSVALPIDGRDPIAACARH